MKIYNFNKKKAIIFIMKQINNFKKKNILILKTNIQINKFKTKESINLKIKKNQKIISNQNLRHKFLE